jgi:hypothetical protein
MTYLDNQSLPNKEVLFIEHGQLSLDTLFGPTNYEVEVKSHQHKHKHNGSDATENITFPKSGFIEAVNQGEGFKSIGWRFIPEKIFERNKLQVFLASLKVTRVKAVFITTQGIYGYNTADDGLIEIELDECNESRMEIICSQIEKNWQQELLSCLHL